MLSGLTHQTNWMLTPAGATPFTQRCANTGQAYKTARSRQATQASAPSCKTGCASWRFCDSRRKCSLSGRSHQSVRHRVPGLDELPGDWRVRQSNAIEKIAAYARIYWATDLKLRSQPRSLVNRTLGIQLTGFLRAANQVGVDASCFQWLQQFLQRFLPGAQYDGIDSQYRAIHTLFAVGDEQAQAARLLHDAFVVQARHHFDVFHFQRRAVDPDRGVAQVVAQLAGFALQQRYFLRCGCGHGPHRAATYRAGVSHAPFGQPLRQVKRG